MQIEPWQAMLGASALLIVVGAAAVLSPAELLPTAVLLGLFVATLYVGYRVGNRIGDRMSEKN